MSIHVTSDPGALMDRTYRHQRHIYDLTRRYYLLGRERLIADLAPQPDAKVLEIGCGTARNLIRAAKLFPDARFHGLDISAEMLATARANVARAGLSERIVLAKGDAAGFDPQSLFGTASFERVFFSYSLSMIPAWAEALDYGARLSRLPGASLSVIDFGQQERLPRWFRAAFFGWLGHFHVTPRAELAAALRGIAVRATGGIELKTLYGGYALYCVIRNAA